MSEDAHAAQLEVLAEHLGYRFADANLLTRALTHPSYLQQFPSTGPSNQRLEFLGDSVLSFILAEELFAKLPAGREGELSKRRSGLARGSYLAELAKRLKVGPALLLSESEIANRGRYRASILEDALEAIIGAIYLDSDFATVRSVVLSWYGDVLHALDHDALEHPKSQLQELVQPVHGNDAIRYEISGIHGPDHARVFTARVYVNEEEMGRGNGPSKQMAEKEAARAALEPVAARLEADSSTT